MSTIIEDLSADYDQLQADIYEMNQEVRARFRELERAEKEARRLELETAFALKFEMARQMKVKRKDLETVLRTKNGDKFRHFVELGGGQLNKLRTAEDRAVEAQEAAEKALMELLDRLGTPEAFTFSGKPAYRGEEMEIYYDNGNMFPVPGFEQVYLTVRRNNPEALTALAKKIAEKEA